ncbi:MAG: biotin-dependent carboxyltransferase family protein [Boseongicola sp.]|nr:biotin-dependent carboxyltransferase family protein [Boseongicola sp.]
MSGVLNVIEAGPGVSLQDLGRSGYLGLGLSTGGAADRDALLQGQALFNQTEDAMALELAGLGGRFGFSQPTRFALTGAHMSLELNDEPVPANTTLYARAGDVLKIGPARQGMYAYLHVAGGFDGPKVLGGGGFHGIAKLGGRVAAGDQIAFLSDPNPGSSPQKLSPEQTGSAPIRIMEGPQTALFSDETKSRFQQTEFKRGHRGNRQGVALEQDEAGFATEGQLTLVSDFIAVGDIQMTGDGQPYVLLADCQTMGGYPRIGTVLPSDLSRIAQSTPGETFTFHFVDASEAEADWSSPEERRKHFASKMTPAMRDPREMADLLSYNLISRPIED